MSEKRIVFMGTPDFAVPSLRALVENGYRVVGVFTQPDRPKGRGGKLAQSPVKEYALSVGLPVFQPERIKKDGLEDYRALLPDIAVTAAFGQILSQEVLDVPKSGTVNVHASLLPRHRGATPVQWTIWQGDKLAGVTTMLTDKGIDTGDMLLKSETKVLPQETAGELLERLSHIGASLLLETLARLENGDCPRIRQNEETATYDKMIDKDMARVDWSRSADEIVRQVRAMNPWPCAWTPFAGGALKLWEARALAEEAPAAPGTILCADKSGLVVAAGAGAVEIVSLQAPGAKRMDAKAYLLGHPLKAGAAISEE